MHIRLLPVTISALRHIICLSALLVSSVSLVKAQNSLQFELREVAIFRSPAIDSVAFFSVTDLALDSEANVYILDGSRWRVQVYNVSGEYLRTIGIGRRGAACGRFLRPLAVDLSENRHVHIFDLADASITIFNESGQCLERKVTGITGYRLDDFDVGSGSRAAWVSLGQSGHKSMYIWQKKRNKLRLYPLHPSASEFHSLAAAQKIELVNGELIWASLPPLQIRRRTLIRGDLWSEESTVAAEVVGGSQSDGVTDLNVREIPPPGSRALTGLFLLDNGRIFVSWHDRVAGTTHILVFSKAGQLLAKTAVPVRLQFLDYVRSIGLLAGIRTLEHDEIVLYEFKMRH